MLSTRRSGSVLVVRSLKRPRSPRPPGRVRPSSTSGTATAFLRSASSFPIGRSPCRPTPPGVPRSRGADEWSGPGQCLPRGLHTRPKLGSPPGGPLYERRVGHRAGHRHHSSESPRTTIRATRLAPSPSPRSRAPAGEQRVHRLASAARPRLRLTFTRPRRWQAIDRVARGELAIHRDPVERALDVTPVNSDTVWGSSWRRSPRSRTSGEAWRDHPGALGLRGQAHGSRGSESSRHARLGPLSVLRMAWQKSRRPGPARPRRRVLPEQPLPRNSRPITPVEASPTRSGSGSSRWAASACEARAVSIPRSPSPHWSCRSWPPQPEAVECRLARHRHRRAHQRVGAKAPGRGGRLVDTSTPTLSPEPRTADVREPTAARSTCGMVATGCWRRRHRQP